MRKPKREDRDLNSNDCRAFVRICVIFLSIFVIWGVLYMPMKTVSHISLPDHLSWMISQRSLGRFILPDNDTSIILPKCQCNGSIFLTVVVCSAVQNFEARKSIRKTWVQDIEKLKNIQVYFLLGKSSNESLNSAILAESEKYSDLIQENFLDTYNNLTLKSVMLLKWVTNHCSNAKYVMKTDDDMFVHLPNLFRFLKAKGTKDMLLGCLIKGATPVKDWNSKWYVPEIIYSGHEYPSYLSGTGYVLSHDTIPVLYRTALETPFFYLEDIFITGICSERVGLKPTNYDGFKFYKRKNDTCIFRSLITAHKMTPKELMSMWKNLHNPSLKCKKS